MQTRVFANAGAARPDLHMRVGHECEFLYVVICCL
jgi:hypothetical protein